MGLSTSIHTDARKPRGRRLALWLGLVTALLAPAAAAREGGSGQDDQPARASASERRAERLGIGRRSAIYRIHREGASAAQLRAAGGDERPASLGYPIPGARIGRGHGSGTNGYHKALDVMADEGTPILAAEAGLVVYTGDELHGYGNLVVLLHPGGWITYYAHCSAFTSRPGQVVERGQRIARVGNTGISRGPHLHFELWMDGEKVDPYPFIRPAPNVPHSGPLPHQAHRVRRGETLSGIAERYGLDAEALRAANHLAADARPRVGWQLLIPVRMNDVPEGEPADPGASQDGTYTVQSGDTLSEIAERFSIPTPDLARWNDLEDASRIRPGMVLVLSGEAVPEDSGDEAGEGDAAPDDAPAVEEPERTAAEVDASDPDEAPAEEAVPAAAARSDVYVVRAGDTLSEIAEQLGIPLRELQTANDLAAADRLRVGQRLAVPDVGGGPAEDRVEADGTPSAEALAVSYVVREGDSLWLIARRFGTSVRRIEALNPDLGENARIVPGQRIRVPRER